MEPPPGAVRKGAGLTFEGDSRLPAGAEAPVGRRGFLGRLARIGAGLGAGPTLARWLQGNGDAAQAAQARAVRAGRAQHLTILHTADIHAQLDIHDEFFWEDGRPVFRRRGGVATLRSMIDALRRQNPGNTLVVDGGDCFQGSAVASFSQGRAMVPLVNAIAYDLVLPGNWEVVYGKAAMIENLNAYSAAKVCANMFHDGEARNGAAAAPIFPPFHTFTLGGVKVGFVGYNDPLTPTRQSPAYSRGIRFTHPREDLARHVRTLRDREACAFVFVLSHMGLAQQLDLANQPYARGVDYILGADTHERIREPLQGRYAKVTEPGAFASFVGKLDLVVEDGRIKEQTYALLDVDPDRYPEDAGVRTMVAAAKAPYRNELERVVGSTTTPLLRYYVIETPMDNLITDALLWKFQTDFAVSNGFRFCPPLVPPAGGAAAITNDYLWSMLPVDAVLKSGVVTGQQIEEWLERELENAFAKDATKRFGGWLVRFKGLEMTFTVSRPAGDRLRQVKIRGALLDRRRTYTMLGCEREGDPDNVVCRLQNVASPRRLDVTVHDVLADYLATHSPVAPAIEGRARATDAPSTLLSQVEGTSYRFR
ncbi:MAG TPA: bifunctional metallophosphatase/5'-nucleotidase [Vicinamibacterales bacterium]|jgi:2',3'-cyclic-nucleotide 2'-phosphodiesterase (5'-nucleotidase family)|nr:bifunctional metallophosphatase/5'-nucleotidase [Vicinamibacterales bacterium]